MVRTSSPSGLERPGEPEELRGREAHALGAARHGFAERHRTARHGHHSRDALLVQGLEVRAFCDAACEHDDGRAVRTGRHRTDELAARRLVVDHALARHDEVRIGRKGGEVHQVKKRIAARQKPAVEEGDDARAAAAGRARAGHVGELRALVALEDRGQMRHAGLHRLDHLGRGALLGAEDPRGAVRAAQGIRHVAQRLDPHAALKEERIEGDVADGAERGARRDEAAAVGRREAHAERSGHAAARVRRAAAAEGDHDAAVARIERLADELARAEGRRVGSGEAGQPVLQARSLRELHIGRVARAQIPLGGKIGMSICEDDKLDVALDVIKKAKENGVNLVLGTDSICGDDFKNDCNTQVCPSNNIPDGWEGMDAGPETRKAFAAAIKGAKTILWNGPAGVFEFDNFAGGSKAIADAIAEATKEGAFSLIGGGDSVACINKFGLADQVSYISTGGGALLEAIEGKVLPGVAAIEK